MPKILLIDDDDDFVESTKIILEQNNFEVITALSGEEGLKRLSDVKPDLILLDVMMPKKSGFEVCKELKKSVEYEKIPVLMLTALSQKITETSYSVANGLELEAEDYIDKPIAPKELVEKINKFLKKK